MVGRLGDANAKVNIQALELLSMMFGSLRERSTISLNTLVPALAANLGSSNDKIRSVASATTDVLIGTVDPAALVQNFSHVVSSGHLRGKPAVVDKLCSVVFALHSSKPHLVAKYAVPAALSLLNDAKGESKAAAGQLLGTLAALMGPALLEHATSLAPPLQRRVNDCVRAAQQASGGRC
jgi:hypothetical protein